MNEDQQNKQSSKSALFRRATIEIGFIIFLFYSNLLMGEYVQGGPGQDKGLMWSVQHIFTITNFGIALVTAIFGHLVLDFFRKKI